MSAHSDRGSRAGKKSAPLRLQIECSFAAVRGCAAQIRAYLAASGVAEKDLWACELAFVEGCNNAVQHTPAHRTAEKLVVELACDSSHVELRINDHTHGFELPSESRLPNPDDEKGRGLYLMRTLMDTVDYVREPTRNCLILKKARTGI